MKMSDFDLVECHYFLDSARSRQRLVKAKEWNAEKSVNLDAINRLIFGLVPSTGGQDHDFMAALDQLLGHHCDADAGAGFRGNVVVREKADIHGFHKTPL